MITQADLAHYRALKRAAEDAEIALRNERQRLLDHQACGVEEGPYRLKVETRESRRFSYDGMVDAIGRLQADRIKALLPVTSTTVLTVVGP